MYGRAISERAHKQGRESAGRSTLINQKLNFFREKLSEEDYNEPIWTHNFIFVEQKSEV